MGKRLRQQRSGRGSSKWRSPSHRHIGRISYRKISEGEVVDILHAPGRGSPVAVVDFAGTKELVLAAEGMYVGQKIGSSMQNGNIRTLRDLPEGTRISNIELRAGDGGKFCRSPGSFATVVGRSGNKVTILLPSREKKRIPANALATVGPVAGFGRKEKPMRKAGKHYHIARSRGTMFPRVSGVAMNAVDHPFGGQTRPGKHKSVSRHAPPGRKVGNISPVRTGKRKGKKKKKK